MRAALREYARPDKIGEDDQLLIYISTHGYVDKRTEPKTGGLAFRNSLTPDKDLQHQTLLPYQELLSLIRGIKCRHLLVVVDACYSGILDNEFRDPPDRITRKGRVLRRSGA